MTISKALRINAPFRMQQRPRSGSQGDRVQMAQTLAQGLRYGNQDTIIHRLDPVVKILLLGALLIL